MRKALCRRARSPACAAGVAAVLAAPTWPKTMVAPGTIESQAPQRTVLPPCWHGPLRCVAVVRVMVKPQH